MTASLKKRRAPLYYVVIGASAGGLEAVRDLLKHLPVDTGMAFIYIQHLSPHHTSTLASILARSTKMPVKEVVNRLPVEPNTLYVCTPDKEMDVFNGKIKLTPRHDEVLPYLPIDSFFISMAGTYKNKVAGVILSGNATDGTQGLKAIREAGGVTFAQDASAKYKSMPLSAIREDVVDHVLRPAEIAAELGNIARGGPGKQTARKKKEKRAETTNEDLKKIFVIVRTATGVDFSHYKISTIKRRLHHRMVQCGTETIKAYIKLLSGKKGEVDKLYRDLLINVTSFFRDSEIFRYLKSTLFPKMLQSKAAGEEFRIWVPACSTGEEAYSIAMLIVEAQDKLSVKIPVHIFATDISTEAIRDARAGEYSKIDMTAVSQKRIDRFFTKKEDRYRVNRQLREMCVFAPQNLLSDPPFSRIDFVSCRNLLIYFDPVAQKKAIATFHFALRPSGYLLLGKSETISTSLPFFTRTSPKHNIYRRNKVAGERSQAGPAPLFHQPVIRGGSEKKHAKKAAPAESVDIDSAIDASLLSRFMPACAVINRNMEIVQFRGSTSLFLSHPAGKASLNILKMARPEFAFELRSAINSVFKKREPLRKTGIEMKIGPAFRTVALEVSPLNVAGNDPLLLVVFTLQEAEPVPGVKDRNGKPVKDDRKVKTLTEKLNNARAEMHAMVELQETINEQLQSANEEIVSSNEEFQTLNEELETSKEEIEASNEELLSTNQELQMRNDLLTESYNYSESIIATIHEPMVVLNDEFRVKSASKSFYKTFLTTREETEGVSLFELGNKQWQIPQLKEMLEDVLSREVDFDNFEVTHTFPGIGEKVMLLNAHRIVQKKHREKLILLAIEDITERSRHHLREKERLVRDIDLHKADKEELEKAVRKRTRELEQKNRELESANKELTAFTYVSSHDLQEPLRKIRNFAGCLLAEEEHNLSETGKDYLARMSKTAMRMQTLIDDLLTYSRTRNSERNFERVSLDLLMKEVIKDVDENLKEKGATIKVGPLGRAKVIPFQFRQLMHNLVVNSLKFSKPRVKPQILVKSKIVADGKRANEKLAAKTKYLNISVIDNGIGFDLRYSERIFEVFQRLHSFEAYKGTGIGLAICKRIVENHHGVITATGKLNKGARFDIFLPLS